MHTQTFSPSGTPTFLASVDLAPCQARLDAVGAKVTVAAVPAVVQQPQGTRASVLSVTERVQ